MTCEPPRTCVITESEVRFVVGGGDSEGTANTIRIWGSSWSVTEADVARRSASPMAPDAPAPADAAWPWARRRAAPLARSMARVGPPAMVRHINSGA